jgi:putative proteasome-type protease
MTYCVGLLLNDGLVFASDSRTNAGVDYVTSFSKLHIFTPAPDRFFVLLSAGNLATTQGVLNRIVRDLEYPSERGSLLTARYLFEAADYIGKVSQEIQREHGPALMSSGVSVETTLLLGGQIQGQNPALMLIYPQGNYFEATPETPYLQIGETKYGKPVLDRAVGALTGLEEGARLLLVSLDATSRSNATVGPPFEVAIYRKDDMKISQHLKLAANDPYLLQLQQRWNEGLCATLHSLPAFDWEPLSLV